MTYYAANQPKPDFKETFDQQNDVELIAEGYLPPAELSNGAAIILIHGGGWKGGNRSQFLWHAHRLSQFGYVTASINYRLLDVASYPAALVDVQAGVRWFRDKAIQFKFDPTKLGAIGSSAGGQLAACLGTKEHVVDSISSKVNCVVDVHGVHDFVTMAQNEDTIKPNRLAYLGGTYQEIPDTWSDASPALHIDKDTVPMLLTHDLGDQTVPFKQTLIMSSALVKNGIETKFVPTPGSGHGFFYNPENKWAQKIWPDVVSWLDRHLLGETTSRDFV